MGIERLSRTGMTGSERRLRSKLNQLIAGAGLVRGTLTLRKVTCGKKGCRCLTVEPHQAFYLTATEQGATRQIYIPKSLAGVVRRWLKQFQLAYDLLDKISTEHWDKLKKRKV